MNRINAPLFFSAFISGLTIKIFTLFFIGVFDMHQYYQWGLDTLNNGLCNSYKGTYFPVQYLIFKINTWLSLSTNVDYYVIFKLTNLVFDIGNFAVIYFILKEIGTNRYYALLYWLHPCFLNLFSLGYVDFQFSFFILVSIYFTLKTTFKNLLFSSFFLGLAFLMKPQVQIIFLSFFVYSLFMSLKYRKLESLTILFFPILFFGLFSFYFWFNHTGVLRLALTYLNISNLMPCLNAQFLNIWFVIAYLLINKGDDIYSISDQFELFGVQIKYFAITFVILLIIFYIYRLVFQKTKGERNLDYLFITTFSSFIVSAFMTSAHENHFFLGSVLLILFLSKFKNNYIKLSVHIILILQFINLYGYYGFGLDKYKIDFYNYNIAFYLSIVTFLLSSFLIYTFFKTEKILINRR